MAQTNGKLGAQTLEFLKEVFAILLTGETFGNAQSGPQYFAVERLITQFDSNQELANLAANTCLDRFDRG